MNILKVQILYEFSLISKYKKVYVTENQLVFILSMEC